MRAKDRSPAARSSVRGLDPDGPGNSAVESRCSGLPIIAAGYQRQSAYRARPPLRSISRAELARQSGSVRQRFLRSLASCLSVGSSSRLQRHPQMAVARPCCSV